MKKVFPVIPLLILSVLVLAAYAAFVAFRHARVQESAELFAVAISENILSTYDTDYFLLNSSESLRNSMERETVRRMVASFRAVGALNSIAVTESELINATWLPSASASIVVRILLAAEFQSGPAVVVTELAQEENNWKLRSFYIESPLLVE